MQEGRQYSGRKKMRDDAPLLLGFIIGVPLIRLPGLPLQSYFPQLFDVVILATLGCREPEPILGYDALVVLQLGASTEIGREENEKRAREEKAQKKNRPQHQHPCSFPLHAPVLL
jgi:hypothetical protein